jgi:peptidyl-tRNA hydrolase, PTH1 family
VSATPKLVVGLGNPGKEYDGTRHNVGFEVVDAVAKEFGCSFRSKKWRFAAAVAEAARPTGKILLAKPQTFMNRSGIAVAALVNWLKIAPAELLVVVDDADLPLGELRLRAAGGSGGHNGLRSVLEALGGDEGFARLRIGIGRTAPVGADITNHVLGKFSRADRAAMDEAVAAAAKAVIACVERGVTAAMNEFNRRTK